MAAKYAMQTNVPIKEMLGGIESSLLSKQFECYYTGYESKTPSVNYIGAWPDAYNAKLPAQYGIAVNYEDMGHTPTHEVMEKRNWQIEELYWHLWLGETGPLPPIGLRDVLARPEVKIDAEAVERFCTAIGKPS
ncbi:hypothetical protein CALVIDRAFT_564125 [Calocera viscosa TUFC12733]|uniref:Fatty acid synthase meander beta sheet domain-containing protein n=1 Tax=Calocera viscosa (strain TUFC12733) TaxID=1330018 RepID=A0A167M1M8_CALVF|nr:hypothetical protein CALVIDRAFT_564125 [Calocera viscosa TUFC12733]